MPTATFFQEQTEQSLIKAAIVQKYFWAWATIMSRQSHVQKLAYIDLFAGPGRYESGKESTPLLVLKEAIADPLMRSRLVTIFNDKDSNFTQTLTNSVAAIPDIDTLRYQPEIWNQEVGENIVELFRSMGKMPTLFFVDPWGYKGLSLKLIDSVLENWGCDCIVFFNYTRVNMGIRNPGVKKAMDDLFGEARAERLRVRIEGSAPSQREAMILEEMSQALLEKSANYVLPFSFRNAQGKRTTHHLLFATKSFLGYDIMKKIMVSASAERIEGVGSFDYYPATEQENFLSLFNRPLDDLADMLLTAYAGKTVMLSQLYEAHSINTPYILKNYQEVLKRLESEGRVTVTRPSAKSPKHTLAPASSISFP